MAYLARGLHGEPVRILQEKLGVDADGIFGAATDAALREYQSDNGLQVDGIAGPDTFMSMGLMELVLLSRGAHGDTVRLLQEGLGIDADAKFGPGTEAAVRTFQEERGVDVDGMAGPQTLSMIEGFGITDEQVGASVISEETPPVDLEALAAAASVEEPPHPEGIVARVEEKVVEVGTSIWNTVKRIL